MSEVSLARPQNMSSALPSASAPKRNISTRDAGDRDPPLRFKEVPPIAEKTRHLSWLTRCFTCVEKDFNELYVTALGEDALPSGNILVPENESKTATNLREIKRLLGLRTKSTADLEQNRRELFDTFTDKGRLQKLEIRVILFRRSHQLEMQLLTAFEERFTLLLRRAWPIHLQHFKAQLCVDLKMIAHDAFTRQPWL